MDEQAKSIQHFHINLTLAREGGGRRGGEGGGERERGGGREGDRGRDREGEGERVSRFELREEGKESNDARARLGPKKDN